MDALALSRLCDDHARRDAERSRTVVDVGPFRALLDPGTDLIWLNYAVPVAPLDSLDEAAAALLELERVFAAHRRTLRFEFNALPWPALPAALERCGLRLQAQHPLMVCTPATFTPVAAPEVTAWLLDAESPDPELSAASAIQRLSFGGEERATSDEEVAELRGTLRAGLYVYGLAIHEMTLAGVASLSPIGDVAELAGVATHPAARRRGVAATLSSLLVRSHFAQGGALVWLSAGDAIAQATYAKLGFQLIDTRVNYLAAAS
jgi:ribosomal protein S18 acetylase RimI-like enzyme